MSDKLKQKEQLSQPKTPKYDKDTIRKTYDYLKSQEKNKPASQRAQVFDVFSRYKKIWAERTQLGFGETVRRLAKNTWDLMRKGFQMFREGFSSIKSKGRFSLLWLMHKISPGSAKEITKNAVNDTLKKEAPVHRNRLTKAADNVFDTYDKALTSSQRSQLIDGVQNAIDFLAKPKSELNQEFNPGEIAAMGTFGIKALYRLKRKYGPAGLKKILESAQEVAKKRGKKGSNLDRIKSLLTANGRLDPKETFVDLIFPNFTQEEASQVKAILPNLSERFGTLSPAVLGKVESRMRQLLGPNWMPNLLKLYGTFKSKGAGPELLVQATDLFKQQDLESLIKGYARRLESAHLYKRKPRTPKNINPATLQLPAAKAATRKHSQKRSKVIKDHKSARGTVTPKNTPTPSSPNTSPRQKNSNKPKSAQNVAKKRESLNTPKSLISGLDGILSQKEQTQLSRNLEQAIKYIAKPNKNQISPQQLQSIANLAIKAFYKLKQTNNPQKTKEVFDSIKTLLAKHHIDKNKLKSLKKIFSADGRLDPKDIFIELLFPKLSKRNIARLKKLAKNFSASKLLYNFTLFGAINPRLSKIFGSSWLVTLPWLASKLKSQGLNPSTLFTATKYIKKKDLQDLMNGYFRKLKSATPAKSQVAAANTSTPNKKS